MAGRPRDQKKAEHAKLNGEVTTPEVTDIAAATKDELKKIAGAPKKGGKGASPEYMRALTKRRMEMIKRGEIKTGPARKKFSRSEVEQNAMALLVPKAIRVLKAQLNSEDEAVAQRAAVKVLEWERGKPAQTIRTDGESIHTIRYETVVTQAAEFIELPDAEAVLGELTEGDA